MAVYCKVCYPETAKLLLLFNHPEFMHTHPLHLTVCMQEIPELLEEVGITGCHFTEIKICGKATV